jgi:hypothetical protein
MFSTTLSFRVNNRHIGIDLTLCVCFLLVSAVSPDPPTNLVVFDETTTTLNARWNPAGGRVQNYKITYVPTAGGRSQTVGPPTVFTSEKNIGQYNCRIVCTCCSTNNGHRDIMRLVGADILATNEMSTKVHNRRWKVRNGFNVL